MQRIEALLFGNKQLGVVPCNNTREIWHKTVFFDNKPVRTRYFSPGNSSQVTSII